MVKGVYWCKSENAGIADYIIETDRDLYYRILADRVLAEKHVTGMNDWSRGFGDILGKGRVVEIRSDHQGDIVIMLDNGYAIHRASTYDGANVGSNLYLESPGDLDEWRQEYGSMEVLEVSD